MEKFSGRSKDNSTGERCVADYQGLGVKVVAFLNELSSADDVHQAEGVERREEEKGL